jgi:hypothetical protein
MTDKEFLEKLFRKALKGGYECRFYIEADGFSFNYSRNCFEFADWQIDLATVIFDHSFHRALSNIFIKILLGRLASEENNTGRIAMLREYYGDLILED